MVVVDTAYNGILTCDRLLCGKIIHQHSRNDGGNETVFERLEQRDSFSRTYITNRHGHHTCLGESKKMDYTAIIIAFLASLPGIYAIIAQMRKDRNEDKKVKIDAVEVAQKSVAVLLDPLNQRIDELENLGKACKARISEVETMLSAKDARILELEGIISKKDKKISEMQAEINELRTRITVLEQNGNGGSK